MEDIIGSGSDDDAFTAFLGDWQAILSSRVEQVGAELAELDGLAAAVLAGSHGRGAPWPLSDIDVILISETGREDDVRSAVEAIRVRLITEWAAQGWWTGLDAGRLLFSVDEVDRIMSESADPVRSLADSRCFHTMDKAFGGRALVEDVNGRAARLTEWATVNRFDPVVVEERDVRLRAEFGVVLTAGRQAAAMGDSLRGTLALWRAVQLTQIAMMGRWGLRDNSLGRFGSRFASAAAERGWDDLTRRLDSLAALDQATVNWRGRVAPAWVMLRHDRSLRARQAVGEEVNTLTDLRDTLRVCSRYYAMRYPGPTFPEWLGIGSDQDDLCQRLDVIGTLVIQTGSRGAM